MAKPFQITLIPDAKPITLKAGWHKRALAAERRHKVTTAPQRGNPAADAKAVQYAEWLAARDGVAVPGGDVVARVDWQPCAHGVRPMAVEWHPAPQGYRPTARGMAQPVAAALLRIELPHWDYEAPPVVETTLREWSAPVVCELPAAEHAALASLDDPREPAAAIEPAEDAPAPLAAAPAPVVDHIEPLAVCPAVGLPCKVDCGFRSTCGLPAADVDAAAVEAAEAEPAPALCASDDAGDWHPDESTHPVTALCLSPKARDALFARVQDGTFPADGRAAKAGAWRLSLADAAACAGIPSVRMVGLPRKPRTPRAAPPIVTIPTPVEAITIVPAAAFVPGAGAPPAGAYPYHAAPAL